MDEDRMSETEEDVSEEEKDLFDSVCSICDNGGDLLWYAIFLRFEPYSFCMIFLLYLRTSITSP